MSIRIPLRLSTTTVLETLSHHHHYRPFSTTAPTFKKFKPQPLYLQPGERKARKCKIPKKILARRAARAGIARVPAERAAAAGELEQGREVFPELDEEGLVGLWRRTKAGQEEDGDVVDAEDVMSAEAAPTHKPWESGSGAGPGAYGLGSRARLLRLSSTGNTPTSSYPTIRRPLTSTAETAMAQRLRETRESLVDLDLSPIQPQAQAQPQPQPPALALASSSLSAPSLSPPPPPPPPPPKIKVHPETVIPAWKIPTLKEYERYGSGSGSGSGVRREKAGGVRDTVSKGWSMNRGDDAARGDAVSPSRSASRSMDRGSTMRQRIQGGWSDRVDLAGESTRTSVGFARQPTTTANDNNDRPPRSRTDEPSSSADTTPTHTPERHPTRWEPTKKISLPAMHGLRALHASDPQAFGHAVLAEKFGISREAVARILRSRFREGRE
ncbi:hypothetical protein QFC21_004048 [Naganishia friedmannii]|uniref:Uncharacterized protein n=1 Tax=Naganishia friedmannii TaxID=89922 RepID=A0ACC2VJB8_9TREE|nr:hypothetical protein QFC21_004048 [Naganishia friedmannii]